MVTAVVAKAASMSWITNIYLWMGMTFLFMVLFGLCMIFIIILAKKTHAIVEFKAWRKGIPICLFFQENRYVEWRPSKPEAGIITDKDYGAFIINERATYVDSRTKNIMIPFDAQLGVSLNVHAAKLADDLQYILQDEEQMNLFRSAVASGEMDENAEVDVLKTSINFGAMKAMMTALLPHNVNSKIEKVLAQRMKGYGQVNVIQIALLFGAMLGAILLGALIIKLTFK